MQVLIAVNVYTQCCSLPRWALLHLILIIFQGLIRFITVFNSVKLNAAVELRAALNIFRCTQFSDNSSTIHNVSNYNNII